MSRLLVSAIFLSLALAISPPTSSGVGNAPLQPGHFAVYRFGGWCFPTVPLLPTFFSIEEADITAWGAPCPVILRWEVLAVADGVAEVRLSMEGWGAGVGAGDRIIPYEDRKEMEERVRTTLNSAHVIELDLATMDVSLPNGTYVGRWNFLLTPGEVARGRLELTRNWWGGLVLEGNVTVTDDLIMQSEVYLRDTYGVSTFALAETECGPSPWKTPCPFPPGLERYLPWTEGGWQTLDFMATVHDAATLLMLYAEGGAFYSDLFFRLYGIIWQDNFEQVSRGVIPMSSIRLVDTNLISMPGTEPGNGEEPGPGDGEEPGDDGPAAPAVPWAALVLLPVAAAAAAILAYIHLRPARWKEGEEQEETRPSRET